jgi:3-oxoacyl-[acyl-carrier protein] reductase
MEIAGKVALVTGASSGIGRATAEALAAAGARVLVVDIDAPGGHETVRRIESAGGRATFCEADVSDAAGVAAMFMAAERAYGGVDIVCNNAGLMSGEPDWPDLPPARIAHVAAVNLTAVMLGVHGAVQAMRPRGGGVVVNTSSTGALMPLPDDPVYAATKAGVSMFTQSCARLKETENVRVNAVLPGMTRTAIQAKSGDGVRPAAWLLPAIEAIGDRILEPAAIAAAILDLIRDDTLAGECRVVDN